MSKSSCESCKMRAIYDKKPKSLLGRIWRWHIGWCPGWKGHLKTLSEEKKAEISNQYGLKL